MPPIDRRDFLGKLSACSFLLLPSAASTPIPLFSQAPSKILLYSGWNTKNIGDQGHTPGTLRFLEQHFPEAQLTVWLSSTNEETNELLRKRFPHISIVRGKMDIHGKTESPELAKAFETADVVIHNSGMAFNSFWKAPSILEACNRNNKAIVLYGQSFDGFKPEDEGFMVRQLSQAAAIYCRDTESYQYLRRIGVRSSILEFGPDGCFGIDLRNDQKAQAYMKQHGLESKKFLVAIIRTNTPAGARPKTLPSWDVGDRSQNPWDPSSDDAIQSEEWARKIRQIIIHWVKETNLPVLLAPEVEKEIIHAKRLLYDRLPADIQAKVVHKAEWWNMDEACSIYRQAHTLVSAEPHSLIMALANRTPIIHLFSRRHGLKAWMFRDIGLSEWLHDIDHAAASQAIAELMQIYENYERALAKVDRAMAFVEQRGKEMIGDIKRLLS